MATQKWSLHHQSAAGWYRYCSGTTVLTGSPNRKLPVLSSPYCTLLVPTSFSILFTLTALGLSTRMIQRSACLFSQVEDRRRPLKDNNSREKLSQAPRHILGRAINPIARAATVVVESPLHTSQQHQSLRTSPIEVAAASSNSRSRPPNHSQRQRRSTEENIPSNGASNGFAVFTGLRLVFRPSFQ